MQKLIILIQTQTMKIFKNLLFVALFFISAIVYGQGVTSSSMSGKITDVKSQPLPGAAVIAIHTSTGTRYGADVDFDGFFRISNMKVGGPYKVTISYLGYKNYEVNNIFLNLGQTKKISVSLNEDSSTLAEIVIVSNSSSLFNKNKTGSETVIGKKQLQNLPSTSRSIADFVRLTPQASITEGNDGFSISLAGNNNRFNAIYVDGAVSNDVFGLSGSGTNGGQTGVSPFSIDAIEQFQVQVAPFDVRIGGFSGGAINAITRSGTNEIEGSVYYFTRNESLAGKTPVDLVSNGGTREKLNDFTAKTYGFRVGGPIVKDKAFFFVNYERQDDITPQPFNVDTYLGDTNSSGLQDIRQFLISNYDYDAGVYNQNDFTLKSDKLTLKFDFNISKNHKASLKHNYTKADNLEARNSGTRSIGFINGSESFISSTNTTAFELNSSFGSKYANSLILGYTSVRDDRDPSGNPFPSIQINDGSGRIELGAEPFSTANLLDSDVFTLTNNFEIYKGKHTITLGTHIESSKVKNLFLAFNYGQYQYASVADFFAGDIDVFQRGYSLVSDGAGDTSSGSADFSTFQLGFYAQDEFQVNDNFKLTAGLRFDLPYWEDGAVNTDFNNNSIPLLEAAGKDLLGARVGKGVDTKVHISPRVGFNWNVNGENTLQVRGGTGVFTGRLPFVWLGNQIGNPNSFFYQMVDPDFKFPQVWRTNIGVDYKLESDYIISTDVSFTKDINGAHVQNWGLTTPSGNLAGVDNREYYLADDLINNAYVFTNSDKGRTFNIATKIEKTFDNGLYTNIAYSYLNSKDVNSIEAEITGDAFAFNPVVGNANNDILSYSRYGDTHRVIGLASKKFNIFGENAPTTITTFFEYARGGRFNYTYGGDINGDGSNLNDLLYIPTQTEIGIMQFSGAGQAAAFNDYIEQDDYLSGIRGSYVDRYGALAPWRGRWDVKFLQDIKIVKNNTLQLSLDILNIGNLISSDWGLVNQPRNLQPVGVSVDQDTFLPTYTFDSNLTETFSVNSNLLSRWQAQFGIRYSF